MSRQQSEKTTDTTVSTKQSDDLPTSLFLKINWEKQSITLAPPSPPLSVTLLELRGEKDVLVELIIMYLK